MRRLLPGHPLAPRPTSKYYQRHSCRSESSGAGPPVWADSGAAIQALVGSNCRWAISEGSLSPTGRGTLKPIGARGAANEGESRSAWARAVGEGPGYFTRVISRDSYT